VQDVYYTGASPRTAIRRLQTILSITLSESRAASSHRCRDPKAVSKAK